MESVAMPVLENSGFGGLGMGAGFIGGLILGNISLYLVDQLKPAATTAGA